MYQPRIGLVRRSVSNPYLTDVVIQANLATAREAERVERAAEAAREAEELKNVAEVAKRRHACLLMYKADEESGLWNESWKMQKHVEQVGRHLFPDREHLAHPVA